MGETTLLGIDLAKNIFALYGVDETGKQTIKKKVKRNILLQEVSSLKKCKIVMESCASCHYWARKFQALGHEVGLIDARRVRPFVGTQKNDINDAKAIVEAGSRPSMVYVAIKAKWQQELQMFLRAREALQKEKTAVVNRARGFLLEMGITINKGINYFKNEVPRILEDADNELPLGVRELIKDHYESLERLTEKQAEYEKEIKRLGSKDDSYKRLKEIPGVGDLVAANFICAVGDGYQFKNGRHCSAWLGLVPRQCSSGGVTKLLGITKRGDNHLRSLMIHGARSVILATIKRKEPRNSWEAWVKKLYQEKGWNVASVALANKMGRVMWHLMKTEEEFKYAV